MSAGKSSPAAALVSLLLCAHLTLSPGVALGQGAPCPEDLYKTLREGRLETLEQCLFALPERTVDQDLLLAGILLTRAKPAWAVSVLKPWFEAAPVRREVRSLLALALLQLGDNQGVLEVLPGDELNPDDPWSAIMAQTRGVALFRDGKAGDAGELLSSIPEDILPGSDWLEAGADFLALAERAEFQQEYRPAVSFSLAALWDSNPIFEPGDPDFSLVPGSPASAKTTLTLAGRLPLDLGAGFILTPSGRLHRSFHLEDSASAFNYTEGLARLSLSRFGHLFGRRTGWRLSWSSRLGLLDGGPLTLEPDLFGYLESHGLTLGWELRPAPAWRLAMDLSCEYDRYARSSRSGEALGMGLRTDWDPAGILSLWALVKLQTSSAEHPAYDQDDISGALGLALQLPLELTLAATGSIAVSNYPESLDYFQTDELRQDLDHGLELKLGRGLTDHLYLEFSGSWTGRSSSIEVFSYDRWLVGTTLTLGFGG